MRVIILSFLKMFGVVPCACNSVTLEAEFRNSVGSVPVRGSKPSLHEERSLTKYWDLT